MRKAIFLTAIFLGVFSAKKAIATRGGGRPLDSQCAGLYPGCAATVGTSAGRKERPNFVGRR